MHGLLARERVRLIDSSHIASIKISVEAKIKEITERLTTARRLSFKDLTLGADRAGIVATFLALLELYKGGLINVRQNAAFGEIDIVRSKIH